uniref:Uncharacterized protein n=1 Tax=Neobodo designis TaxID=312471 RepID=A0A7S1LBA2_NEODS
MWLFDRLAHAAEARAAAHRRAALEDAPVTTDHTDPPAAATRAVVRPAYAVVPRGNASSHREQPPKTHKHHALKASAERGVPAMAIAYDARFAASFAISLYSMSECAVGDYSCYPRFYTEHGALKRYAAPRSARYMGQGCPWDLAAISQRQWLAAEALDWRLTPSGDDLAALIAKYMTIDEAAAAARYAGVSE